MFTLNTKLEKMLKIQGHHTIESYYQLTQNEYQTFKEHIPNFPKTILDLGCGLGRVSAYINKIYDVKDTKYILADSSVISPTITMGWDPGESWYNDLSLTKEFCDLNRLGNYEILDLTKDRLILLKDIDLVYSFMAVGFHYPIETYCYILKKIMNKDGTMIFGVRKGKYENSTLLSYFKFAQFYDIPNEEKERVLVLKGW